MTAPGINPTFKGVDAVPWEATSTLEESSLRAIETSDDVGVEAMLKLITDGRQEIFRKLWERSRAKRGRSDFQQSIADTGGTGA